jgi:hypothetical protein
MKTERDDESSRAAGTEHGTAPDATAPGAAATARRATATVAPPLHKEAEPDDPTVLVGVAIPGDAESVREMAYAFAEEFASMGFDAARILALFRSPHYAGAHEAYKRHGEHEVRAIVDECLGCYGAVRFVVRDAPPAKRFTVDQESGRIVTANAKEH